MKVGDAFIWVDSRYKNLHGFGPVIDTKEDGKLVVSITWPESQGELRMIHPLNSYVTRSSQLLHAKKPGNRILEARHEFVRQIWSR